KAGSWRSRVSLGEAVRRCVARRLSAALGMGRCSRRQPTRTTQSDRSLGRYSSRWRMPQRIKYTARSYLATATRQGNNSVPRNSQFLLLSRELTDQLHFRLSIWCSVGTQDLVKPHRRQVSNIGMLP